MVLAIPVWTIQARAVRILGEHAGKTSTPRNAPSHGYKVHEGLLNDPTEEMDDLPTKQQ